VPHEIRHGVLESAVGKKDVKVARFNFVSAAPAGLIKRPHAIHCFIGVGSPFVGKTPA
jgi:hypothetical protein